MKMKKTIILLLSLLILLVSSPGLADENSPDTTPPEITIIGANPYYVKLWESYNDEIYEDQGVKAWDNIDGDITSFVITVTNIDQMISGEYYTKYIIEDSSGNVSVSTRKVIVAKSVFYLPISIK